MLNPLNIPNIQIEEFANSIGNKLSMDAKSNIIDIVSKIGGSVAYYDCYSENKDCMIIKDDKDFTIFVSKYLDAPRVKFCIAHELGHYFLHYLNRKDKSEKVVFVKQYEGLDVEREASAFALFLLMPEEEYLNFCKKYGNNMDLIGNYFGVNHVAVDSRSLLYELKQKRLKNG